MKRPFFILLLLFPFCLFSQKEVNIWYFGNKAGLDFNSCSGVTVLNNSAMVAKEGTAVMSDANGALLFYTNGVIVYTKNHTAMANGTGLNGGSTSSASQNALIVPDPANAQRYYIFTADEEENSMNKGVCYSIVDMSLNGGLGDVTTKNTNIIGGGQSVEKLTAYTRPAGGYWVVSHGWNNNRFYVYALTTAGLGAATTTNIGTVQNGNIINSIGPLKFSPDGTKLASCNYFSGSFLGPGYWELFDFNLNTGAITNAKVFSISEPFGLEFSSNSNKLYVTSAGAVFQYDISSNTQATIAATKTKVSSTVYAGPLQLGPDCKIYVSTNANTLDVINSPNAAANAVGYVANAINLAAGHSSNSVPNFLRSYFANMTCVSGTLSVTATPVSPISCKGGNDGSFSATANGCNPPYSYTWQTNPPQASQTATGLQAGTYTIIVSDQNNSTSSTTVTITEPSAITIGSLTTQTATCGSTNGSAMVSNISGGIGSTYTYSWSTGASTNSISQLATGNYTLTVSDANGCTQDSAFSINSSGGPNITTNSPTHVSCNGGNDGVASVTVNGSNITYSWSPAGGNNAIASNLSAGTYTVTVNDGNQCQSTATVSITEPLAISAIDNLFPASCQGATNGSATITPSNGTGSYTYSWSTGTTGTNNTISNLTNGNYSVTITDGLGCSSIHTFTITQTGNLSAPNQAQAASCQGVSDGAVTINTAGGTAPYTYSWSNGTTGTANNLSNLSTGSYSVVVTDAVGCTVSADFTVTQIGNLALSVLNDSVSCFGSSDGILTATPTGGTPNYTYSWSNNQTTPSISGLNVGSYSLTITDGKGCTSTTTSIINQPNNITSTFNISNATLNNSDGSATANVVGGTPGYTYTWINTGITNNTLNSVSTGTYTFVVEDNKGCLDTTIIFIDVILPCYDPYVPNAFSPNDDGLNDVLFVRGLCIHKFELSIYNRWGEKVFYTTNMANGWPGTFRGRACDPGVYAYQLTYISNTGAEKLLKGNITLVR